MSVYSTIWYATAFEEGPRRDTPEPVAAEPYFVDVAIDGLTRGEGEKPWLRISVGDDLLPEGCSATISPEQARELLAVLQRWAEEQPAGGEEP